MSRRVYTRSTGSYIDLDFVPDIYDKYEFSYRIRETFPNGITWGTLIGNVDMGDSYYNPFYFMFNLWGSRHNYQAGTGEYQDGGSYANYQIGEVNTVTIENRAFTVIQNDEVIWSKSAGGTTQANKNMRLLGAINNVTNRYPDVEFYYLKIWDNESGDLIHDIKPYTGGVYDYITQSFYPYNGNLYVDGEVAYEQLFLVQDVDGKTYTVQDGAIHLIDGVTGTLTAQDFLDYGVTTLNGNLFKNLNRPKFYFWQNNTEDELPLMKLNVNAVPLVPQKVTFRNIFAEHSVKYLTIASDPNTLYNVSFDNGNTWKYRVGNAWANVNADGIGNTKQELERLSASAWQGSNNIRFRAWLFNEGRFQSIRLDYN